MLLLLLVALSVAGGHVSPKTLFGGLRPKKGSHLSLKPVQGLQNLPKIKTKTVMINVYAGPLLNTYPLLVESARRNPQTTWLLVHIGKAGPAVDLSWAGNWASNFILVQSKVDEMKQLAKKQLSDSTGKPVEPALSKTLGYKLNDWKPFYGALFANWISECKFWGYWDLDLIYGSFDK